MNTNKKTKIISDSDLDQLQNKLQVSLLLLEQEINGFQPFTLIDKITPSHNKIEFSVFVSIKQSAQYENDLQLILAYLPESDDVNPATYQYLELAQISLNPESSKEFYRTRPFKSLKPHDTKDIQQYLKFNFSNVEFVTSGDYAIIARLKTENKDTDLDFYYFKVSKKDSE